MSNTTIYDVIGIGNAIVDVLAFCEDTFLEEHDLPKGAMMLIDEERAEYLYQFMAQAAECSGGSAANTLAGLAMLGATPAFVGKVKQDQLGEIFTHDLRSIGVQFNTTPALSGKATARSFIFVTPDGQRTMNTFLGACADVTPEDVNDAVIAKAKLLYVEGYLWDAPHAKEAILKAIHGARAKERKVAISLSDVFCVDRHRPEFLDLIQNHVDVVFGNENEIKSLMQTADFDSALKAATGLCPLMVLTRSEKGCYVVEPDAHTFVASQKVEEVMDTTGAGDLFASGFLYGYVNGWDHQRSARLGHRCAAHIIQQIGARPMKPLSEMLSGLK
jgi:sugar/nucleoside kinase (ribokinase family)